MTSELLVYVDLNGKAVLAGQLWSHFRNGRQSATFQYGPDWIRHKGAFSLDPSLPLASGAFQTAPDRALFGGLGDSAPDTWGRMLMRRAERRAAKREERAPNALSEVNFLCLVDDEARQGALRFRQGENGPWLTTPPERRIPPLVDLPQLLAASTRVIAESDDDDDLRLLLAPGASLGGARPKASVRDRDGMLSIAKFPHPNDDYPLPVWEAVALDLARRAGIPTCPTRIETIADRPVMVTKRFDRDAAGRVPFMSAMTFLQAADREPRSYLEIADIIRQNGYRADLHQLWRRMVFNVLISNVDDHMRNHGFLYDGAAWKLSPAYDLNPVPGDVAPRFHASAFDVEDRTGSLKLVQSVAAYFDLRQAEADQVVFEVGQAVQTWRQVAAQYGLRESDITRMESAFEHKDLALALQISPAAPSSASSPQASPKRRRP